MTEWNYVGYVKVHTSDRRKMEEFWDWKCEKCGYEVRKRMGRNNKPTGECPRCAESEKEETE